MAEAKIYRRVFVYKITHEPSGRIYFGVTNRRPEKRWAEHRKAALARKGGRLHRALRKYGAAEFSFKVVCVVPDQGYACTVERGLIAAYGTMDRRRGFNMSTGGELSSGVARLPSTKAKLSQIGKAQWADPEYRERAVAAMQGRELAPEFVEHLRQQAALMKGKPRRPESIEKGRASLMGHAVSEETRAKIGAKSRGRKFSDATKAKVGAASRRAWAGGAFANRDVSGPKPGVSEALKRRWRDPEARAVMIENLKRGITEETRAKVSAASRAQWADPDYRRRVTEARAVARANKKAERAT